MMPRRRRSRVESLLLAGAVRLRADEHFEFEATPLKGGRVTKGAGGDERAGKLMALAALVSTDNGVPGERSIIALRA